MNGNGKIDLKPTSEHDIELSYIRFDPRSTPSTCSSLVLSSCSGNDKNDNKHTPTTIKWKRQKIISNDTNNPERSASGNDLANSDQNLTMSTKENIAVTGDDERRLTSPRRLPPIPADKLHRRNPHTVRQEITTFQDLIPETNLADVHLSEMPGLHNTEQWKRIAGRAVRDSPPLSRQYYQTVISTIEQQNGQVPQPLGSYRRPGRSEEEQDRPANPTSRWRTPRRRIFFGSSVAVVIVAIIVAVVLAVTLAQKTGESTTDYYSGTASVRAKFDQLLLNPSSSLAKSYKREFCTLIGTTLADTKTRYALYYSTCSVIAFRNGSIIADFVLGFTRSQNVTRLSSFLNHTLINQELFGGTIESVALNLTGFDQDNSTNSTGDGDYDDDDDSNKSGKLIMTEQNLTNDQAEPTRTTYTTVTYTKLDKGLSITISETITITNNNTTTNTTERSSINNKNYELILVPSIDENQTAVIPTDDTNERSFLPPALPATTTTTSNAITKSPSHHYLLPAIKPVPDTNFAYIDESSDDRTYSSDDGNSTLEDLTARDSTASPSTLSLNDDTLLNSTSTLVNNSILPIKETTTRPIKSNPPTVPPTTIKTKEDDYIDDAYKRRNPSHSYQNGGKRERRMIMAKNQRRLLQYELMPTGKVYYIDRPFSHEKKLSKDDTDDNSSVILSTILSRSSSLDTLSDKHYRRRYHRQQQPHNEKLYPDLTLKKSEEKLSIGGRLASTNNLTSTSSPFKPINVNKKKRFSSFDPTPESLDRVFDVLIAADKRREEHEFWREKFDPRQGSSRLPLGIGRAHETSNANTMPFIRSKQTHIPPKTTLNPPDHRSHSYTTKRNSSHDTNQQRNGCLLEDCLRRRTLILQQQHHQTQRNYSPNVIYSTNYFKQESALPSKPPLLNPTTTTTTTNQQPIRILPLTNGRIGRAPQARQTSDELSSLSDIWATRSSFEDESRHPHQLKKPIHHARFQSTATRPRMNEQKSLPNKRTSSVEQQKSNRLQTKTSATTKNKFFDLFKFNR